MSFNIEASDSTPKELLINFYSNTSLLFSVTFDSGTTYESEQYFHSFSNAKLQFQIDPEISNCSLRVNKSRDVYIQLNVPGTFDQKFIEKTLWAVPPNVLILIETWIKNKNEPENVGILEQTSRVSRNVCKWIYDTRLYHLCLEDYTKMNVGDSIDVVSFHTNYKEYDIWDVFKSKKSVKATDFLKGNRAKLTKLEDWKWIIRFNCFNEDNTWNVHVDVSALATNWTFVPIRIQEMDGTIKDYSLTTSTDGIDIHFGKGVLDCLDMNVSGISMDFSNGVDVDVIGRYDDIDTVSLYMGDSSKDDVSMFIYPVVRLSEVLSYPAETNDAVSDASRQILKIICMSGPRKHAKNQRHVTYFT